MKRRILETLLIGLATWPMLQFGLTRLYAVNPWKLFGYAMYSVPGPRVELEIVGVLRDGRGMRLDRRAYTAEEARLAARFVSYRAELGALASGSSLAAGVLDQRPEFESVVIVTRRYWIDPETARVAAAATRFRHWRDGRREPFVPPDG